MDVFEMNLSVKSQLQWNHAQLMFYCIKLRNSVIVIRTNDRKSKSFLDIMNNHIKNWRITWNFVTIVFHVTKKNVFQYLCHVWRKLVNYPMLLVYDYRLNPFKCILKTKHFVDDFLSDLSRWFGLKLNVCCVI